jgi:YD repeat-containing protein
VDVRDLISGQTRTTVYTYTWHPNGLPATITVDAPSPDGDIVETWSTSGDLLQVRNAAGHVTTLAAHNARGQPGRITTPAGAVTEYVYDARGRTLVERTFPSGVPVETRYIYGASGLLEAVQSADGNTVLFHHDAARRLVQEDMTEPDGAFAVRRTTYNAMSQPIKVETGRDQ